MSDYQFYRDLAEWWPLISPVADYEEEASFIAATLLSSTEPVNRVLELGSGGGHNASFLKKQFDMTLVDVAPEMVAVSRRLNPECDHHIGDMRWVRLDSDFDAVLIHDAVDYMTDETDLTLAMATARFHCRSGGTVLLMPDFVSETYIPGTNHGGSDTADGRSVRYLEWSHEAQGTTVQTDYVFVLHHPDGASRVIHEVHTTGLFPESTWLKLLTKAGFTVRVIDETTTEDRPPRHVFVATRLS